MGCESTQHTKASFPKDSRLMNVPTSAPVVATVNRVRGRSVTQITSLQTSSLRCLPNGKKKIFQDLNAALEPRPSTRRRPAAADARQSGTERSVFFGDLRAVLPGLLKHLGQSTLICLWRTLRFEAVSSGVVHKERRGGKINDPLPPPRPQTSFPSPH